MLASLKLTLARLASPGRLAHTRPCLSAIANIVIHTMRTGVSSHQIVLSVMELKSFVKLVLIVYV